MNILFLSLEIFDSINNRNMYTDVLRVFAKRNHVVYSISPIERRTNGITQIVKEDNSVILRLKIGNIQKTHIFEKGISTITIQDLYIKGIKKYFSAIKFDLVLYSTPPITFYKVIKYVKDRDNAKTYLMLKDIFPQNAVDLEMIKMTGVTSIVYRYFRYKEIQLYKISDFIGCMSPANVTYLLKNNMFLEAKKVGICPNVLEPRDIRIAFIEKIKIRKKYRIPVDKTVFVYGGNLGKPQGIPFIIECLKNVEDMNGAFFLIIGDGTEYYRLEKYIKSSKPSNVKLMKYLPVEEYDLIVGSCDVGLIFLDYRFTIPNFPSRILSYMQAGLPILACTDPNTDIGEVIVSGGFGWRCGSNDVVAFKNLVSEATKTDLSMKGKAAYQYLQSHYSAEKEYKIIMESLKDEITCSDRCPYF